jgi:hypothetical protein
MAVAKDHGTPGHDVIHVFFAVHVDYAGTLRLTDKDGGPLDAAKGPDGAVNASGDDLFRLFKKHLGI